MAQLFISHSSADDDFVRELRAALADHGQQGWIDSRELRGGDLLWPDIQQAIEAASAFAVVVSPDGLQSKWVGKELRHAIALQQQRGKDRFPVIPLSLDSTKLGVLEEFFDAEPTYIAVSRRAAGIESAINHLLVAIGQRLPSDPAPTLQPKAEPLEELVLELTDLKFHEQDGVRRPSARARLVYEPATPGQPQVHSAQPWRLVAPIGPIEAEELRWYLEKYAIWPSHYFADRAHKVEVDLVRWGQQLHEVAMPPAQREKVMQAWARIDAHAGRRFSVLVDTSVEAGASEEDIRVAQEAATRLLGLPWELLHDGQRFLFQGARPVRVRRRLPGTEVFDVPVVATPIRILLVSARPDDDACGYIDHRVSALPLVDAMESLPGLVELEVLNPPTLKALGDALDRARAARAPYHVVHFDGHGVYDRHVGLGGLCFEAENDTGKLDKRGHAVVYTRDLGQLLRDHRIPLVCLEACQSAQAEQASESVASELLKVGVASVVAMSHSVLVETARRFVGAFYAALADGKRVGDAMLTGQRTLKDDSFRGSIFRTGELRLQDWFVPVLFQEKDDPQLFTVVPAQQTVDDFQTALRRRLGALPPVPQTGFVGRSRDLLALQRLLHRGRKERYAVVLGQGGEGKTTLVAEFARWMVRSQQIHRAAFVSVEGLERNIAESVLDTLGQQLLKHGFSTQADCHGSVEQATQQIERALCEQSTLLVLDNMESVLLPPYLAELTPEALSAEAHAELQTILALAESLLRVGDTRLIFTSREPLPAPFDAPRHRRELRRLDHDDAVKLVERTLNAENEDGDTAGVSDAERVQIEALVDEVHGHARTLALLAPALRTRGVETTRTALVALMAEMDQRFPGSRERSVFASVALSLRRLSPEHQQRVRALGVFHGSVDLDVLARMMEWDKADAVALAVELVRTGLATPNPYDHLSLNPSLCPYMQAQLEAAEHAALTARWATTMRGYVTFLCKQRFQSAELAATLTGLELANLLALLSSIEQTGDAEATIDLSTGLYGLLQNLGRPRLLTRLAQVRDAATAALGEAWSHARFEATRIRIEQLLADGDDRRAAIDGAQELLQRARAAGEQAYPGADYDLAGACWLLGRTLQLSGGAEQALPLLAEARQRFEVVEREHAGSGAARMASVCIAEQGDCLRSLGRYDLAATAYEDSIRNAVKRGDIRGIAVGKFQLGTVRLVQEQHHEAFAAYQEAIERFTALDELSNVAAVWHQIGMAYADAGQAGAAEDAYRTSLAIKTRLGDTAGQAATLGQLGGLYAIALDRLEEAVAFYRQAVDIHADRGHAAGEGRQRNNLGAALCKLGRLDEARQEIRRAMECSEHFGHAAEPWRMWDILTDIEAQAGNPAAAAEARRQAVAAYLAYRRDGGESQAGPGRLALDAGQLLLAGDAARAEARLAQLAEHPEAAPLLAFIAALQAIVAGSRDRHLAAASDLKYSMSAEILLLIDALEQAGR